MTTFHSHRSCLILIAVIVLFSVFKANGEGAENPKFLSTFSNNPLSDFLVSGGPPPDGIPPLDKPHYVSIKAAEVFMEAEDVVFIIESDTVVKVFPQKIMVFHEIVNDAMAGKAFAMTYCPLVGAAIGYYTNVGGNPTSLGTSGKLLNSNLVMYDRRTNSYWPQILGSAIQGKSQGKSLKPFPVQWTRWKYLKASYPGAQILSIETGYSRPYGHDPYGSYNTRGNYYDNGILYFPVLNQDTRLSNKEVVIGVKDRSSQAALLKRSVINKKILQANVGKLPILAIYDPSLDTVRVFNRTINGIVASFEFKDGKIMDRKTGSQWSVKGEALQGHFKGRKLSVVPAFDVMWFAWAAFYPNTPILL